MDIRKIAVLFAMFGVLMLVSPESGAAVSVYDGKGQYLGVFMGHSLSVNLDSIVQVYVPSLRKTVLIDKKSGDVAKFDMSYIFYESANCSGTPYYFSNALIDVVCRDALLEKYFMIQSGIKTIDAKSRKVGFGGPCYALPAKEKYNGCILVEIPKGKIPFSLPVALPLRYNPK